MDKKIKTNPYAGRCKCKNITTGSKECYAQMILVDIPKHMEKYAQNRKSKGLSTKIGIDPCIYLEIKYLWSAGIITYGSCCGHNKRESFVNVDAQNIKQMLNMGYKQNHSDKRRIDTFRLKSV